MKLPRQAVQLANRVFLFSLSSSCALLPLPSPLHLISFVRCLCTLLASQSPTPCTKAAQRVLFAPGQARLNRVCDLCCCKFCFVLMCFRIQISYKIRRHWEIHPDSKEITFDLNLYLTLPIHCLCSPTFFPVLLWLPPSMLVNTLGIL